MKALRAQYLAELRQMLRQGEQLLVAVGVPVGVLIFFGTVDVGTFRDGTAVRYLVPGTLALGCMSTAMVSLGIGTAFEREYSVLKRLGATPLGRGRWLLAKILLVLTVEVLQAVVLCLIGLALGWKPEVAVVPVVAALVLGTAAFSGLGLLLAGRLPATTNLAVTNGLYLALMVTGGMIFPLDKLPAPLEAVAQVLPAANLSGLLIDAFGAEHLATGPMWAVLGAWAVAMPALAATLFRWQPANP